MLGIDAQKKTPLEKSFKNALYWDDFVLKNTIPENSENFVKKISYDLTF